ncbi:Lactonase drp35 (fragment) [Agrobacterium tumefaciens str. CFBP 5621]
MTDLAGGRLHKATLSDPTTIAPFGSSVAYSFIGGGPDSLRLDADGNAYVAVYGERPGYSVQPCRFPHRPVSSSRPRSGGITCARHQWSSAPAPMNC